MAPFSIRVSIVVPVFGAGADLPALAERVAAVLDRLELSWELIFVNDGSPGPAWDGVKRLATERPAIKGINLRRNFGQQNALLAGIRATTGELIVTIDDDLQHPPEEIPKLLQALHEDIDVVYGTPEGRVRGWTRNCVAATTKAAMASVLGTAHARSIGAFRIFRGSLRRVFQQYDSPHVSVDVLLSWATTRIASVPVAYARRSSGRSGYRLSRLVTFGVNMVTGFSVWPLRLASIIGIGSAAFGAGVLVFVVARYLTAGVVVPGFAFLACMIAIFAGAQLLSLGIIGEYLARMYFRTMNKPSYVIESTVNLSTPERAL